MMKITLLIFTLLMFGCAVGGSKIEESDQSLGEIKKAIVSIIGEPRKLSENQREFTGQYVERKSAASSKDTKHNDRYYYQITILGSRRPYDIEVRAFSETKVGKTYKEAGEDSMLANKLARELEQKLNKGRDGRNLIDDFRAF